MARLDTCSSCTGFLPPNSSTCPHCGAAVSSAAARRAKTLFYAASGSLIALTLMACYGGGPYDPPPDTDTNSESDSETTPDTETDTQSESESETTPGTTAGETTDTDTDTDTE